MDLDRTEVIIGATGRIARKYTDYLVNIKHIPVILVSRVGDWEFEGHPLVTKIQQDLTSPDYTSLERVLDRDGLRIVYLAGKSKSGGGDLSDYEEVNFRPVERLVDIASKRGNILTYASTYRVLGPSETDLSERNLAPQYQGNYYANSKRDGENVALNYDHGQAIRFTPVLGMKGDFVQNAISKISRGQEACAWGNVFSRFVYVNDACFILNRAGEYKGQQKLFHAAAPDEPASRYDLVQWFAEILQSKGSLPSEASNLLIWAEFDFKDGRRPHIDIETEITQKELGFVPTPIQKALVRSLDSGYPFFNSKRPL